MRYDGKVYLTEDYDYSRTTSKYLNVFCGCSSKEIDRLIKEGSTRFIKLKK